MSYINHVRNLVAEVKRAQLTPFDLLSWEVLLQLRTAHDANTFLDLDVMFKLVEEIDAALLRKATALDDLRQTDFYSKQLSGIAKSSIEVYGD